jgi:tetratricopeptide (TPR) repeat protein
MSMQIAATRSCNSFVGSEVRMRFFNFFVVVMAGSLFLVTPSDAWAKGKSKDLLKSPEFINLTRKLTPEQKFELAAVTYIYLRDYPEAIALLEVLVEEEDNRASLWYLLGIAYLGANDPKEAHQALNIAVTLDPAQHSFLLERGIAAHGSGQFQAAVKDLVKFNQTFTQVARSYYFLGLAQARLGKFESARQNLKEAKDLNWLLEDFVNYQVGLIDADTGDLKSAAKNIGKSADIIGILSPRLKKTVTIQAQALLNAHKSQEWSSLFRDAIHQADVAQAAKHLPKPLKL